jgi:CHAT domain-containing protein
VAEAIRQYERATDHLEALYQKRAAMAGETNAAGALASLDEEIRKAQDAQRDAGEARQAAAPGFGALVQFSVSAEAVQALLKPGEAVAVTVLGDAEGWTLLVRKDRIFAGRIAGGAERIDALVKRFRAAMEVDAANHPGPFDAEAAFGLYNAVLGPVADGMTGVTALNVATSGSLLSVPFGALLTSPLEKDADLAAAKFLIEGVTVSHTPSAAGFVNLRSSVKTVQANRPWFGMGDFKPPSLAQAAKAFPVKPCGASAQELADLAPLPADLSGLDAARAILHAGAEDQLLGSAFTAGNVVAHPLSDYRMIHFATHAVLPGELECLAEPAILTSTAPNAPDVSGSLLTASQIESMHLDAELVILAACNTGGPNGTAAGESLSGLARAFFYAGARSLLVTHWDANAKTTTYLTARFLEALQAQPEAGPAAALAASQRRMLAEAKGDRAYQVHPYYWAVAALIGGRGAGVPASGS